MARTKSARLTGRAVEHRSEYQRLIKLIRSGEVGAVFASDISRISRDRKVWLRFLSLCAMHGVSLYMTDPRSDIRIG